MDAGYKHPHIHEETTVTADNMLNKNTPRTIRKRRKAIRG